MHRKMLALKPDINAHLIGPVSVAPRDVRVEMLHCSNYPK